MASVEVLVGPERRRRWSVEQRQVVAITAAQLAYMLDGIDWRNPVFTWRPEVAG